MNKEMSQYRFRSDCKYTTKTEMQDFAMETFWTGTVTALRKLNKDELCKRILSYLQEKEEQKQSAPKRILPTFLHTLKGKRAKPTSPSRRVSSTTSPIKQERPISPLSPIRTSSPILFQPKQERPISPPRTNSPIRTISPILFQPKPQASKKQFFRYSRSPARKGSQTTFEEFGIPIPAFREKPKVKSPSYRQTHITQFMKAKPVLRSPPKTKKVEKQLTLKDLWAKKSPPRPPIRRPPPVEEYLIETPPKFKKQLRFADNDTIFNYSIPSSSDLSTDSSWSDVSYSSSPVQSTLENVKQRKSPSPTTYMPRNVQDALWEIDSPIYSDKPYTYAFEGSFPDAVFTMDRPIDSQEDRY